ncbi:MAG TPA: ABC transporter ATP-binding protein [Jiangellaceae bacterium]
MATLEVSACSRWFGNVVAVNDVTMTIGPGITGLLGPNGAGKSTLIHMLGGFLPPSTGTVTLDGEQVWKNHNVYRTIGLVPEREATYDFLTGWQFALASAELHGLDNPGEAASRALETVAMQDAAHRKIRDYSKGMKQRVKMASALVHEPAVLLLDEPFNGMDPRQRLHLIDLLRKMGANGRTVLFSSHILEEVEQLANRIDVLIAGRYAASGDFRTIRRLMTDRPHRYVVRSDDNRALASVLISDGSTAGVRLGDGVLHIDASEFLRFAEVLPRVAREAGIRLYEVSPADESLESVFSYLVEK